MLKRIVACLMIVIFSVGITACDLIGGSTTEKYLKAFEQTFDADTICSKTEIRIEIDASDVSEKISKGFESFSEIIINTDQTVDNVNRIGQVRTFAHLGEIIMDSTVYWDNDRVFMKIPLLSDGYLDISMNSMGEKQEVDVDKNIYNDYLEMYREAGEVWKAVIEEEVLASEGNSVKNTPDGDIKVTQLSLELTDEKAKSIVKEIVRSVTKDEKIKQMIIKSSMHYIQGDDPGANREKVKDYIENLSENIEKLNDKVFLEEFKMTARIDRDCHIIDETIEGTLVIKHEGEIRVDITSNTTNWDINEPLDLKVPEISEEDLIDISSLKADDFEFFQDIIDN